jgi:hypothetical protein
VLVNPGANGGNMTMELPRNVIDSKGPSNAATKYQVKIDGKGKQLALSILRSIFI